MRELARVEPLNVIIVCQHHWTKGLLTAVSLGHRRLSRERISSSQIELPGTGGFPNNLVLVEHGRSIHHQRVHEIIDSVKSNPDLQMMIECIVPHGFA